MYRVLYKTGNYYTYVTEKKEVTSTNGLVSKKDVVFECNSITELETKMIELLNSYSISELQVVIPFDYDVDLLWENEQSGGGSSNTDTPSGGNSSTSDNNNYATDQDILDIIK